MRERGEIKVRRIRLDELDALMAWREEVLDTVFAGEEWDKHAVLEANRSYYEHNMGEGHVALVATIDGEEAACGAVCFYDEMPSPDNPTGKCAYLMNIYTRPAFREKGAAHAIIRELVAIAKERLAGKVYLEATAMGQPVYESLGFRPMAGMMKLSTGEE